VTASGWPLLAGSALAAGFFALLYRGPLNLPILHRYFAGHPINMIETAFFFVGLSALAIKLLDVMGQKASLDSISLGTFTPHEPASKASELLDKLAGLPARLRDGYLGRRLMDALESVERKGSAEGLDEELRYLADLDVARQHDSYALVKIIVWATPMLGFLGTVVGITDALGDLARQNIGDNLNGAMQGLLSGLYVAFDTTAIALSFSMVLMFLQFGIDRMEAQLLAAVDHRVGQELLGRFAVAATAGDPHLATMQRIAAAVIQSSEQLVKKQVELWQASMEAANQKWQQISQGTTRQLESALKRAMTQHADYLAQSEAASAQQFALRWEQWQTAFSENARMLHKQQQEMARQGELMTQAIKAAGEVMQLEKALNQNLSALAGAKNFEDTVMSLAAAIHLLNARLGRPDAAQVDLRLSQPKGRAA
jgi:biopolymer transport protein ExbB/TolQ